MKKPQDHQAKGENLAPNDPHRMPKEHRVLVNKAVKILQDADVDMFESQTIFSAAAMLSRTKNLEKSQYVMNELIDAIRNTKDAQKDIQIIVEVLNLKMTEALNKQKFSSIEFEELPE